MTTITHTRGVHVDAPVERVFDHVKDPRSFAAAMAAVEGESHHRLATMTMAPDDGVGSTWEWEVRFMLLRFHPRTTREEYVPNERIVDHTSSGLTWTYGLEPEGTGTKLTLSGALADRPRALAQAADAVVWNGDEDLDKMLAAFKQAIEAGA